MRIARSALRRLSDIARAVLPASIISTYDKNQRARRRRQFVTTPYGFELSRDAARSIFQHDWEENERQAFLSLLSNAQLCVDVGANVGYYTLLSGSKGVEVIAIEPDEGNIKTLLSNVRRNSLERVTVFPVAVGSKSHIATLHGRNDMASLVPGWGGRFNQRVTTDYVSVVALDSIVRPELARRLLIKVDVEGYELDLLAGAIATLEMHPRPVWMVEIVFRSYAVPGGTNAKFLETFETFWSRGYRAFSVDNNYEEIRREDVLNIMDGRDGDAVSKNFIFRHIEE